ncbi:MAG TPA: YbaB/EbfC family nucleoid-associated protein [Rhizomicrobium sp.]|jgi:hypothetical protein|nr:YbaB/EbfC family nucleoid-associated protein [Rhizomicrobium sp.]
MDMADLVKRAQEAQSRAQAMQAQIALLEIEGHSGGGMVRVTISGKADLKKVAIDPSLIKPEDREVIEDLIVAAHGDAKNKLERRIAEEMQKLSAEMGLPPGLGLG